MTVSVLERINPASLSHLGFAESEAAAKDTLDGMQHVDDILVSETVWRGAGQPEAEVVSQINRVAAGAAQYQMESAKVAMEVFQRNIERAQRSLTEAVGWARQVGYVVNEDGTLARTDPGDHAADQVMSEGGKVIQSILAFATLADVDAKAIIFRVSSELPTSSDTADPDALLHNQRVLDDALETRRVAFASAKMWKDARVPNMQEDYGNGGSSMRMTPAQLYELVDDMKPGMIVLGSAVGLGEPLVAVPMLAAVIGVPPAAITGLIAAVGLALIGIAVGNSPIVDGEPEKRPAPSNPTDPTHLPEVEPHDGDLQEIFAADDPSQVADYYRYLKVSGEDPPPEIGGPPTDNDDRDQSERDDFTYPAMIRNQLQTWMRDHPHASAEDRAIAQYAIDDLQDVLEGTPYG